MKNSVENSFSALSWGSKVVLISETSVERIL